MLSLSLKAQVAPITAVTFNGCKGTTITLHDATLGGTWSSSNSSRVSVNSLGIATCNISGSSANITYTVAGVGSYTQRITVDPSPAPITDIFNTGIDSIAVGDSVGYTTGSTVPVIWTVTDTTLSYFTSLTSGLTTDYRVWVHGLSAGTQTIFCTRTSNGCYSSKIIQVY